MTSSPVRKVSDATWRSRLFAAAVVLCAVVGAPAQPVLAQQPGGAKDATNQAAESNYSSVPVEQSSASKSESNNTPAGKAIEKIAASGRVLLVGESSSSRLSPAVRLAPGAPPILAFRYLDGQARHRFGDLDLVMDDAGH